ncbi:MAG: hypothetical protein ACC656_10590 [Candidatus Heimdallarchaeota archaeon]
MEGIEFLENDAISILETKGIHTIEDLGDYSGDDSLVLQLQFLVKNRLEKLKHKLDIVKSKQIAAGARKPESSNIPTHQNWRNPSNHSINMKKHEEKREMVIESPKTLSNTTFLLNKGTLDKIDDMCKQFKKHSYVKTPKMLLISVLNCIITDILQLDFQIKNIDFSLIFQEVAELSSITSSAGFYENLVSIGDLWNRKEGIRSAIIDNYSIQILKTAQDFIYNELFSSILERKVSRLI